MVKSAFPYPGGKSRLSDDITSKFSEHIIYVEPFGGSAGVLLNKPRSKIEVYNDIDAAASTFFEKLRDTPDELREYLRKTPYSKVLNEKYEDEVRNANIGGLELAAKFYYVTYSNHGGKIPSGFKRPTDHDGEGGSSFRPAAGTYTRSIDALETISERLQGVTIDCMDYAEIIEQYDGENTFFYLDPPFGDGSVYDQTFDPQRIPKILDDITGNWMLSYGAVPEWAGDYIAVRVSDGREISPGHDGDEYLIMNYDPDDAPPFSGAAQTGVHDFL